MKLGHLLIGLVGLIVAFFLFKPDSYEIKNAKPRGESIVCFGDSLTFGTGATKGMSYPDQLSRMIGKPVINLGVPGDTTADALARLETVLDKNPRMVLMTIGGNDLMRGVPKDQAFGNLRKIVERIQQTGALVVIGGIEVPLLGRGFGEEYQQLSRQTGSVLIENVLDGIIGHNDLMSDTIHPNSQGYTLMAEAFYQAIKPYLSR